MDRLSYYRAEFQRRWQRKSFKIGVGWTFMILGGTSSFLLVRNMVMGQRQKKMKLRQKVEQEVKEEQERAALNKA